MPRPWRLLLAASVLQALLQGGRAADEEPAEEEDPSLEEYQQQLLEQEGEEEADGGSFEEYRGDDEDDAEIPVLKHSMGRKCIDIAEVIEKELGYFDDSKLDEPVVRQMALRLQADAKDLVKNHDSTFADKLQAKMVEVHQAEGNFGAPDACHLFFSHHGEL